MISTRLSAEADAAAHRYGLMIESWRAFYRAAMNDRDLGSAAQMNRIAGQAYETAKIYLANERRSLEDTSFGIASEAHWATLEQIVVDVADELPLAVSEHLEALVEYVLNEIAIQIERDIAFLKQSLQRASLQIRLSARSRRTTIRAATLEYRIGNVAELDFFFHDRRNMKWPSRKFIRAIWRQHLLAVYNETALIELAEHGHDIAEIWHPSPNSEVYGMRLSMKSSGALPTYSEVRNQAFHPNSDAIIVPARA